MIVSEDYAKARDDLLDKLTQMSVLARGMLDDILAIQSATLKILEDNMAIKVTHYGIDYATVNIAGAEFEVTIALAKALEKELKNA